MEYPTVSVICPIKGVDYGLEENIQAIKNMNYPSEWELIFVLDDDSEPAYQFLKEEKVVFCGQPRKNKTGKLNAMAKGLEAAKHEMIAFVDSDVRPQADTLRKLVEPLTWRHFKPSATFGAAEAVSPPQTIGDACYSVLLNGLYATAAATYFDKHRREAPFIMGQFMVLKRDALEVIGGLASANGQLVDDMFIGQALNAAGHVSYASCTLVPIVHGDLKFGEFLSLFRKWMAFSQSGLPWSFKSRAAIVPIIFWLAVLVAVMGLTGALGALAGGITFLFGGALAGTSCVILGGQAFDHTSYRGFYWLAPPLVLLIAPFVFLSLKLKKKVSWRGRSYNINSQGTLK